MRRLTALIPLIILACGGSTTGPDGAEIPGVVAALTIEEGAAQSARAQRAMPDSVVGRAMDDAGTPVSGQLINLEVPAGPDAGSFDADALTTNGQGRIFAELTAGTRAWTARVRSGEDSAYTARLVASKEGRADEIRSFTFAVQPGPPVALNDFMFAGGADRLHLRVGDVIDVLEEVPWPARDQWDNPIPADAMRGLTATWTFAHFNNDVGAVNEPTGSGWTADPVPELHRLGWHPNELRDSDTTDTGHGSFEAAVESLPDSLETRGTLQVAVQELEGTGRSGGVSELRIDVLLPVCWETEPQGSEGVQRFVTIPWEDPCPTVEPS